MNARTKITNAQFSWDFRGAAEHPAAVVVVVASAGAAGSFAAGGGSGSSGSVVESSGASSPLSGAVIDAGFAQDGNA